MWRGGKSMVWLAWRGPSCVYQCPSAWRPLWVMMLMEYLTDTAVSLLQMTFVETNEPLASKVGYSFIENSVFYLAFGNVPVSKLSDELQPKLFSVMEPFANGTKYHWDGAYATGDSAKDVGTTKSFGKPHDTVAFMAIGEGILYDRRYLLQKFTIQYVFVERFLKIVHLILVMKISGIESFRWKICGPSWWKRVLASGVILSYAIYSVVSVF